MEPIGLEQAMLSAQSALYRCENVLTQLPRGQPEFSDFCARAQEVVTGLRGVVRDLEPRSSELAHVLSSVQSLDKMAESFADFASSTFPHLLQDADPENPMNAHRIVDLLTMNDALHFIAQNQRALIQNILMPRASASGDSLEARIDAYESAFLEEGIRLTREANARTDSRGSEPADAALRIQALESELLSQQEECRRWRSRAEGVAASACQEVGGRGPPVRPSLLKEFQMVSKTMRSLQSELQAVASEYERKFGEEEEETRLRTTRQFGDLKATADKSLQALLDKSFRPDLKASDLRGELETLMRTVAELEEHHGSILRRVDLERKNIIHRSEEEILRLTDDLSNLQSSMESEKQELLKKAEESIQSCTESCDEKLNFFNMYWEDQYSQLMEELTVRNAEELQHHREAVLREASSSFESWKADVSAQVSSSSAAVERQLRLELDKLQLQKEKSESELRSAVKDAVQSKRDLQLQLVRSERYIVLLLSRMRQLEESNGAVPMLEPSPMFLLEGDPMPGSSMPPASAFSRFGAEDLELNQILGDLRHQINSFSSTLHQSSVFRASTKTPLPSPSLFEYIGTLEADNKMQAITIDELQRELSDLRGQSTSNLKSSQLERDIQRAKEELRELEKTIQEYRSVPLQNKDDNPKDVLALSQLNDQLSNTLSLLDSKLDELAEDDTDLQAIATADDGSGGDSTPSSHFSFLLSSSSSSQSYLDLKNYIMDLELKIVRLERQIVTDQTLINDQKDQLDVLYDKYRLNQERDSAATIQGYRSRIDALSREKESLRDSLGSQVALNSAQLRTDFEQKERENQQLMDDLRNVTDRMEGLESRIHELEDERQTLLGEGVRLKQDAERLKRDVHSEKARSEQLRQKNDRIRKSAETEKPSNPEDDDELEQLQREIDGQHQEINEQRQEIDRLQKEASAEHMEYDRKFLEQEQRLKRQEQQSQKQVADLIQEVKVLQSENARLMQMKRSSDATAVAVAVDQRKEIDELTHRCESLLQEKELLLTQLGAAPRDTDFGTQRKVVIPVKLQKSSNQHSPVYMKGSRNGPLRASSMNTAAFESSLPRTMSGGDEISSPLRAERDSGGVTVDSCLLDVTPPPMTRTSVSTIASHGAIRFRTSPSASAASTAPGSVTAEPAVLPTPSQLKKQQMFQSSSRSMSFLPPPPTLVTRDSTPLAAPSAPRGLKPPSMGKSGVRMRDKAQSAAVFTHPKPGPTARRH